jgi:hypothetical protein
MKCWRGLPTRDNGSTIIERRRQVMTTKLIRISEFLAERDKPEALKVLNEMDKDMADQIINFILGMIIIETRIMLGLEDVEIDDDFEAPLYTEIQKVYKEYYNNCFFCEPHAEFKGGETEICILCHKKIVEYIEFKYGDGK